MSLSLGSPVPDTITRVERLKDLQRRWAAELPRFTADPERTLHLLEALDDLGILIRRLEHHDPTA